ncbi:uncharacterized protein LOC135121391 [Zophobas morio]|uniref:uncharacterized protein LOC135121391 n=1 Tax=Zophobas morio TaxID=2755281 RepID=UPI003082702E
MDSDFCFQKKAEMENKSIVDPRLSNNGRRVLENSESCESGSSSSGDMDEGKKIIMVKIQPVSELPTKKEVGDSEAYYLNFDYPEPNKVLPTRAHRSLYRTKPQKRSDKLSSYLPHLSSGSVSLEKKLPLCYRLAIMEGVNVYFKGNDLGEVLIEGKVYFSTSITVMNSWSQENESIILKLHHFEKLDTVVGNPAIFNGDLKDIVVEDKLLLGCNKISEALKKHGTIRESDATVDLFCYQMKETSYRRVPLLVYTLWDCQQRSTSLELYIKHNEDGTQA